MKQSSAASGAPAPGRIFKPLTSSARPQTGPQPQGQKALVRPTGVTSLTTKPSSILVKNAGAAGLSKDEFVVWYGVDEVAGCVAVYTEKAGYPGSTMVRVSRNGKNVGLHLGSVFEEYPDLRPATRVDAITTAEKDANGRDVLVIQLNGALPHVTVPRKSTSDSSSDQKNADRKAAASRNVTDKQVAAQKTDTQA